MRGNVTDRTRTDKKVIHLISNPHAKQVILAAQEANRQIYTRQPVGFGYFLLESDATSHWEIHGLPTKRPDLAIGALTTMLFSLMDRPR